MATAGSQGRAVDYLSIRCVFECPILDDHKWAKLPGIPADMVFVDLEDSVPPHRKGEARDKARVALRDRSFFGDRLILARPNHLSTPWGHDDVRALVEAGADCLAYPKIRGVDDLVELKAVLDELDAAPDLFAIVETAGAVVALNHIAAFPNVVALMSGPGDLSVDAGMALYEPDGELNPAFLVTKVQTVLAGAAHGLATTDIAYAKDIRDLAEIRRRVEASRRLGFTGMSTFYPPHVEVINDVFGVMPDEVARAESIVTAYERGLERGDPAVLTDDGEALLVHDYEKAVAVLRRAGRRPGTASPVPQ